jgi:hypothetical protein
MRDIVLIDGRHGEGPRWLSTTLFACDGVVWTAVVYLLAGSV